MHGFKAADKCDAFHCICPIVILKVRLRVLQSHDSKCQHVLLIGRGRGKTKFAYCVRQQNLHIDMHESAKYHDHEVLVAHANSIFYQHTQTKIIKVFFLSKVNKNDYLNGKIPIDFVK